MNVRIRDRINSVAGSMDEAHGRPFVLGRAARVQRPLLRPHYSIYRNDGGVAGRVEIEPPADATAARFWLACVLMPDGTWRDDCAFLHGEVFERFVEPVPFDPVFKP